jgi:hypothetical protein
MRKCKQIFTIHCKNKLISYKIYDLTKFPFKNNSRQLWKLKHNFIMIKCVCCII